MKDKVWCTESESKRAIQRMEELFNIKPMTLEVEDLEEATDTYYNQEMVPKVAFDDVVASLDVAAIRVKDLELENRGLSILLDTVVLEAESRLKEQGLVISVAGQDILEDIIDTMNSALDGEYRLKEQELVVSVAGQNITEQVIATMNSALEEDQNENK